MRIICVLFLNTRGLPGGRGGNKLDCGMMQCMYSPCHVSYFDIWIYTVCGFKHVRIRSRHGLKCEQTYRLLHKHKYTHTHALTKIHLNTHDAQYAWGCNKTTSGREQSSLLREIMNRCPQHKPQLVCVCVRLCPLHVCCCLDWLSARLCLCVSPHLLTNSPLKSERLQAGRIVVVGNERAWPKLPHSYSKHH